MKRWLIIGAVFAALFVIIGIQAKRVDALKSERDVYESNTKTLLTEIQTYKTKDSLNVARCGVLELQLQDFEEYRRQDAELIKTLQTKNRELQNVTTSQTETIIRLSDIPTDTIIIVDSVQVPAISLHCSDEWYKFNGIVQNGDFTGTVEITDELLSVESIEYKRFLFWRTRKVKNRRYEIVSKCPYTTITDVEYILIEN